MIYGMGFFINSYIFGSSPYIVDVYSPIGAWATSKISSTATNCLRVRRSSDNAEQDIGFVGNDLDTASLTAFVGANDGYVTKFYNQGTGGATYDVLQTTTGSQPRLVSGGVIDTDPNTGAIATYSTSGTKHFATSSTLSIDDCSMISVARPITTSTCATICAGEGATGKRRSLAQFTSGTLQMFASGYSANLSLGSVSATNTYLSHGTFDNVNNVIYGSLNGSTTSGSITLNTPVAKKITLLSTSEDGDASGEYFEGHFTMAMIWNTQNESNMANVVADINNLYSIY